MYFADIIGQEQLKEELRRSFSAGILPHAQLFVSEDGVGALALAYAYARYINCLAPTPTDACGQCRSCRNYDQYAALDLHYLFPIVNVGSRNLCEDELPAWRNFLALGAHSTYQDWLEITEAESKQLGIFAREGNNLQEKLSYQVTDSKYRIVLIWLPEKMNDALANKLLKLTEEPPERTILLMASLNEPQVLGTLRSRMQTTHLRPLTEEQIGRALRLEDVHEPQMPLEQAAHLARGNYRRALDYYRGDSTSQPSGRLIGYYKQILRATVDAQPVQMKTLAEDLAKLSREEQLALVHYAGDMVRESYFHNFGMPELHYLEPEEQRIVNSLRSSINKHNVRQIHEELDLAVRHIQQNVNSRMVFFDLILRLTSLLAPHYLQAGIRK